MRLSATNKNYINHILTGSNTSIRGYACSPHYLDYAFSKNLSPQGGEYWRDKIRQLSSVYNRKYRNFNGVRAVNDIFHMQAETFEEVLTEEDWGYLKWLIRDKRKKDKFLTTKRVNIDPDSY